MSDSRRSSPSFASQAIEQWHLAEEIADEAARTDIESYCLQIEAEGLDWFDTQRLEAGTRPTDPYVTKTVARAVRYLGMRDHIYGHHTNPALVRFR